MSEGEIVHQTGPDPSKPAFSLKRALDSLPLLLRYRAQASLAGVIQDKAVERAVVEFSAEIQARQLFLESAMDKLRLDLAVDLARYGTPRAVKGIEAIQETVEGSSLAHKQPRLAQVVQTAFLWRVLRTLPGSDSDEDGLLAAVVEAMSARE